MVRCSQCSKNAMYSVDGHPLCLRCWQIWDHTVRQQLDDQVRALNFLAGEMESIAGIPRVLPRYEGAKAGAQDQGGPMTFNNINLNNSTVGVINTGTIGKLDVAVDAVRAGGQEDLAEVLKRLSQAVVDAPELAPEQKNEAAEHLAFVAEQAALPRERRQRSVAKAVTSALERLLSAAASASAIWQVARPYLEALFQQRPTV